MFMFRCSVSLSFMYQSATSCMPSGFACTARMMSSLQDPLRLVVVPRDELIARLDQLVRAEHFGRVEAAVEPDDRLPFLRQRVRLGIGQALALGELHRDVLVLLEHLEVRRIGDDRGELRTPFRRLSDLDDLHPVGLGVDLLPVRHELVVVGQEVVVTDVVAEKLLRRRDVPLSARCSGREQQRQRSDDGGAPRTESPHRHPEPPEGWENQHRPAAVRGAGDEFERLEPGIG